MSVVKDKSFTFAIQIVDTYKFLTDNKKEYILSKQLLRSGTAIRALIREAQNAESKADFVHKMGIAQKECDETIYWIELLKETEYLDINKFKTLHYNATEVLKMLRSIIVTTKKTYNL
ncbi:four helix bundle protein [Prevotella sp. 10(H)]|uniref:four helix bundle protein n=1 Tax=Prevotella sp. 10(H) TaxID=1158294 RepID=UPI0004A74019|nr:four helix bundle protein [Prevotella sp. 10(H)]